MDEDESLVERVEVAGGGPVGARDGTLLAATAEDERERERKRVRERERERERERGVCVSVC